MPSRKKTPRSKQAQEPRTKLLAPEFEAVGEYRDCFGMWDEENPEWDLGFRTPDLDAVAEATTSERVELLKRFLRFPYNAMDDVPAWQEHVKAHPRGLTVELPDWAWLVIRLKIKAAVKAGFYFAVMRYADALRDVPELARLREEMSKQRRQAGKKRGAQRKQEAEGLQKEAMRIDRELRELPAFNTQASRNAEIANQLGKNPRTIQSYFSRAKKSRSRRK